jgi:hypothetical protein
VIERTLGLAAALVMIGCKLQPVEPPPIPPDGTGGAALLSPPPISGGTLLVLPDQKTAVAGDPDHDKVWIVDLTTQAVRAVALTNQDEPGRVVADGQGLVHVVLRRGGAVATIDPVAAQLVRRETVCPAPRGIGYDAGTDRLYVACMDGQLMVLPAAGGDAVTVARLDPDLRDVLVVGGKVMVTTLRTAELLTVASDGSVTARQSSGTWTPSGSTNVFTPSVAWRTIALPSGGLAMLHQRGSTATINLPVPIHEILPTLCPDSATVVGGGGNGGGTYGGGGGGEGPGVDLGQPPSPFDGGTDDGGTTTVASATPNPCNAVGPIVHSTITTFDATGAAVTQPPFRQLPLPVDLAVSPDGKWFAAASAARSGGIKSTPVFFFASTNLAVGNSCNDGGQTPAFSGQVTSVAALDATRFVVLTRDATTLTVWDVAKKAVTAQINLDLEPTDNPGHTRFHVDPGSGLACASCHPEGGDDGRVWQFDIGPRRTMALRGGLRGTEPFHWSGDESDLSSLMTDVFEQRMGGTLQCQGQVDDLADWMETLQPIPTTVADPDAVDRGRQLFESPQLGCFSCHSGPQHTNNQTDFVGTGGDFQVPRLVGLAFRAPYLHDGCAKTLADRFGTCGGGDSHGHTSQLSPQQIADLVAFLQTL